jgi:hypothetical protein
MPIAYLAHPVGERDLPDDAVRYGDNMANAHDWVAFLTAIAPDLVLECSWIPMNTALSPRFYGGKLTTSAHTLLHACSVLVLVGGLTSPHMRLLIEWAKDAGVQVLDLCDLGTRPPWQTMDETRAAVARRLAAIGI